MNIPPEASKRRNNKYWLPYAWAVRVLVERGHGVTESARTILMKAGEPTTDSNVACLRVVYYSVRNLMWPPEYEHLRPKGRAKFVQTPPANPAPTTPVDSSIEDFEV